MPWTWWILLFGTPIITVIGVTGNILSFCVLKTRRYRFKSYSHYLCTLAVFDSLVLIDKLTQRINKFLLNSGQDGLFVDYNDATCKVGILVKYSID